MREVRIYQPGDYNSEQELELTPEAGQHVAVVLRMQVGDALTLFNGRNFEFQSTITRVKKKQVFVSLTSRIEVNRESPLSIHLGQALSKGDRMEWVVQKAAELGVASISPLITERCAVRLDQERMLKKTQQWQAIVIAACEQCGRNTIPVVHPPINLGHFLQSLTLDAKYILHTQGAKSWRDYSFCNGELALLIGPEGGFSEGDISLASRYQCEPLSLGPRILRTETAAISALSLLQAIGGDL